MQRAALLADERTLGLHILRAQVIVLLLRGARRRQGCVIILSFVLELLAM